MRDSTQVTRWRRGCFSLSDVGTCGKGGKVEGIDAGLTHFSRSNGSELVSASVPLLSCEYRESKVLPESGGERSLIRESQSSASTLAKSND